MDASQGVEAQTLANTYLALQHNLEIIPVINKIDLPSAEPERIREQIEQLIGLPAKDALLVSAKSGLGVKDVLEAIVHRIPAPKGSVDNPFQALVFDSWFDIYRGAVVLVRVMEGTLKARDKILSAYETTLCRSGGGDREDHGLGRQDRRPDPKRQRDVGPCRRGHFYGKGSG